MRERTHHLEEVVRAFPGILRLDVETNLKPCVQFLRDVGIVNVARILVLIPPILRYYIIILNFYPI